MLGDSSNTGFNHMVLAGFALIPDLIRIEPAAQPEIAIRVGLCDLRLARNKAQSDI